MNAASYDSNNALVLLSGGLDSAVCLTIYKQRGYRVQPLFVDYGQPAREPERHAALRIAELAGCSLRITTVSRMQIPAGEIRGRNALLLLLGLMTLDAACGVVVLGIHAGTPYADCGQAFVAEMSCLFDTYCSGGVRPSAPLIEMLKGDVYRMAVEIGVPIEATYSCERGSEPPCGTCASCIDRLAINAC